MALYLLWHVSLHLCTQQQATERFSVCTNTYPTTVQSVQLKRAPKEDIHSKIPKECLLLTDKVNEERKYCIVLSLSTVCMYNGGKSELAVIAVLP